VTTRVAAAGARRPPPIRDTKRWSQGGWAQTGHPCCSPFGDGMGFDPPEQFIKQTTSPDG